MSQEKIYHYVLGQGGWLSRADIARGVGYPKGTALIKMLDALVKKGYLRAWYGVIDGTPQPAWYYKPQNVGVR